LIAKLDIPAFIYALYFWGFVLLRTTLQKYQSSSTIILAGFVSVLFALFIINRIVNKDLRFSNEYLLIIGVLIVTTIDVAFRYNPYIYKYIYQFVYSGLIPIILLSRLKNAKMVVFYYSWFSVLAFILLWDDPLNGFLVFSGYMDFGFNLALPAFIGFFIGFHYFRFKLMLLLEIICFLEIIVFANRSVMISIILFILLYYLLTMNNFRRYISHIIFPFSTVIIVVYLNLLDIIFFINKLLFKMGYWSYSINQIKHFIFNKELNPLFSSRLDIWSAAIRMIELKPIVGHGIGSFQSNFGTYSHNLFLDLLIFFGLVGFVVVIVIIYFASRRILRFRGSAKLLGLMFFVLWFPKLIFSSHLFLDIGFWSFLAFAFLPKSFLINNKKKTN